MKKTPFKAFTILLGLLLAVSFEAKAGAWNSFEKTISNNFGDPIGIYIITGIVGGSLLLYYIFNHVIKGEEEVKRRHKHNSHRHHRHVVRKTA